MEPLSVEDAPDRPLPREQALRISVQEATGRPLELTDSIANEIVQAIRAGAFLSAAAGRVGVSRGTLRDWIRRGEADNANELDSIFSRLSNAIARAQSEHEVELAASFSRGGDGKYPDWRAQAFLAERRYEHWRLPKEAGNTGITLTLPPEALAALSEALRVANAKPIESATNGSGVVDAPPKDTTTG